MRWLMFLLFWLPVAAYLAWAALHERDGENDCPACLCLLGECRGHRAGHCPICAGHAACISDKWLARR